MNTTIVSINSALDIAALEDQGYVAFYNGIRRIDLTTDAERHGFDEAAGEWCYHQAMIAEAKEIDAAQGEYSDWRWA